MRYIYIILILILSACGFKPLYSDDNQEKLNLLSGQIKLINKINDYDFSLSKKVIYKNFSTKFNFSNHDIKSKYHLFINNINESEYPIDLDMDGNASEYSYNITIDVTLKDMTQNGKIIFNKSYNSKVNLNIGNSYYSSIINKRSYQKTLAKNIAEQCYQQLLLLLYH